MTKSINVGHYKGMVIKSLQGSHWPMQRVQSPLYKIISNIGGHVDDCINFMSMIEPRGSFYNLEWRLCVSMFVLKLELKCIPIKIKIKYALNTKEIVAKKEKIICCACLISCLKNTI